MFEQTIFTPWTLFTDCGIISMLLLLGKYLRVKVKWIQKLFIPPSLLAGLFGLALGPNGLGWIPLSPFISTYSAILIALIFGALPLASPPFTLKSVTHRVGSVWAYAQLGLLLQWSLVGLFGFFVIKSIWPELNDAFAIMLPTGFYGGHGTAAAIGATFKEHGWEDATSLGMTTATIGVVWAIIGGLFMIKWATRHNHTAFVTDFKDLPSEMRSGLVPKHKRDSMGEATTSSISIESLTLHLSVILTISFIGFLISQSVKTIYPTLEIPIFSCAFITGLILNKLFHHFNVASYINIQTTQRLSSSFTDLLVAYGVASIQLGIVLKYTWPLITLIIAGTIIVWFITIFLGKKLAHSYWFERSVFAWGWWTGSMAMGIALLRIVDPQQNSKAMDDYAIAYLPIAPVEIIIITLAPILYLNGYGLWLLIACLFFSACIILLSIKLKWWNS